MAAEVPTGGIYNGFGHIWARPSDEEEQVFRYYAWASVIENGEIVATDYAPDSGWFTLLDNALPDLRLPSTRLDNPAGTYGWTGESLGSVGWMHGFPISPDEPGGEMQMLFAVADDCFVGATAAPIPVTVGGRDGLYLDPYDPEPPVSWFVHAGDTTVAYALPFDDRTLCVLIRWASTTTPDQRTATHQVVESIRGRPYGEDGIRINFDLPAGWDTG